MQKAYIAYKLRSGSQEQVNENIQKAFELGRAVMLEQRNVIPLVPHQFAIMLNSSCETEDAKGISYSNELLRMSDYLYVFGEITRGIAHEISRAKILQIPIVYYAINEKTNEIQRIKVEGV